MEGARGTWTPLLAAALLLAACSGDAAAGDPAGPIDDAPPTGEGPTACMPENAASEWSFAALGSGAQTGARPRYGWDGSRGLHVRGAKRVDPVRSPPGR